MQRPEKVQKADGKLAVLLPGMGAVSTTLMAGVMLANKGLVKPIGSITQSGTIRLGKRTDNRVPRIKDFAPLAKIEDIVFGGWDLFPDNAYEAAAHAKVLESKDLDPIKDVLYCEAPDGHARRSVEILVNDRSVSALALDGKRPAAKFNSVVLPQPEGPTSTTNSLSLMSRFTSMTACH